MIDRIGAGSKRRIVRRAAAACALPLALLALQGSGGRPAASPGTMRNLVLITMDDCRADAPGTSGNPMGRTPNLDRLAAEGVRFNAAFVQAPACNPSRTSFLTGRYPPATGVLLNSDDSRAKLPPDMRSLPQILDDAGFVLANVGKLFHQDGEENVADMRVFDHLELCARPAGWEGPASVAAPPPPGGRIERRPERGTEEHAKFRREYMDRYGSSGLRPEEEEDARAARAVEEILPRLAADGRRFFLAFGTSLPHAPMLCPEPYVEREDPAAYRLPPGRDADRDVPPVAVGHGLNADVFVGRKPTDEEARAATAAYHACVSFADEQIGRVLRALDECGVAGETVVVLTSDHGFHLGEHGHWAKYTFFEPSLRVPLIVRVPGAAGAGGVAAGVVELVDLVPTIGELLGVPVPPDLDGVSFAAGLEDPRRAGKPAAFAWMKDRQSIHRSVRTDRWRYNAWEVPGQSRTLEELYDLWTDPQQLVNRANDPALAGVREDMAARLAARR